MKLAILSCSPKCYSTERLVEAAKLRGHSVRVLNTLKFAIDLERGDPDLYYRQDLLEHYDAVIPRIGASITYYGTAVVKQFQQMDVFCANTSNAIITSRDKLRSLQILSKHGIGIPKTAYVRDKRDVLPAIERVGGAPVIIKLIEGTQGIGVLLAETLSSATSIVELLQSQKQNVLIQKFVAESKGRDVRAIVVGDQVVAAMRRVAQGQEFRSNIHRGGVAEQITLSPEFQYAAVKATQLLGLQIAGVDMLESKEGPQIMEVNSSPGLKGIESCTKLDIAGAIVEYLAAQVDFPEIDIRERLTVSKGYGVSELYIPEGSEFVGKTIEQANFRGENINVLTLTHNKKAISNPRADRVLHPGDRLLCFGKLESMRSLVPPKVRKRRKPEIGDLDQDSPVVTSFRNEENH